MNTPAHLLLGAAIFARPEIGTLCLAALAGAVLPDLSLVLMAFWAISIQGISPQVVFDELYFSESWQTVFAIDNSIPLWGFVFGLAFLIRSPHLKAFAGAGLLHIFLDFLLHHDDGRAHFWPFSMWKFESPISYWDSRHFGQEASVVLFIVALIAFFVLWKRMPQIWVRGFSVVLIVFEARVALTWIRFF